jgi:rhodanese-related sulfurtransferase
MDKPTPEIAALKRLAAGRAPQLNLPYAGALLPREAHQLMQAGVRLVDVRTRAELDWVGRIPGALPIEWSGYPGNTLNPGFLEELADFVDKDEPVMFVCRSAGRSHHAAVAATGAGWRECYNVLEGFEGNKDALQHRNTVEGWRLAGLPWVQS